jgi:hypothetical protein
MNLLICLLLHIVWSLFEDLPEKAFIWGKIKEHLIINNITWSRSEWKCASNLLHKHLNIGLKYKDTYQKVNVLRIVNNILSMSPRKITIVNQIKFVSKNIMKKVESDKDQNTIKLVSIAKDYNTCYHQAFNRYNLTNQEMQEPEFCLSKSYADVVKEHPKLASFASYVNEKEMVKNFSHLKGIKKDLPKIKKILKINTPMFVKTARADKIKHLIDYNNQLKLCPTKEEKKELNLMSRCKNYYSVLKDEINEIDNDTQISEAIEKIDRFKRMQAKEMLEPIRKNWIDPWNYEQQLKDSKLDAMRSVIEKEEYKIKDIVDEWKQKKYIQELIKKDDDESLKLRKLVFTKIFSNSLKEASVFFNEKNVKLSLKKAYHRLWPAFPSLKVTVFWDKLFKRPQNVDDQKMRRRENKAIHENLTTLKYKNELKIDNLFDCLKEQREVQRLANNKMILLNQSAQRLKNRAIDTLKIERYKLMKFKSFDVDYETKKGLILRKIQSETRKNELNRKRQEQIDADNLKRSNRVVKKVAPVKRVPHPDEISKPDILLWAQKYEVINADKKLIEELLKTEIFQKMNPREVIKLVEDPRRVILAILDIKKPILNSELNFLLTNFSSNFKLKREIV